MIQRCHLFKQCRPFPYATAINYPLILRGKKKKSHAFIYKSKSPLVLSPTNLNSKKRGRDLGGNMCYIRLYPFEILLLLVFISDASNHSPCFSPGHSDPGTPETIVQVTAQLSICSQATPPPTSGICCQVALLASHGEAIASLLTTLFSAQ